MRLDRIKLITELTRQDIAKIELAEKAGVSRSTISGICSGKGCRKDTAEAIARALNVNIENLM